MNLNTLTTPRCSTEAAPTSDCDGARNLAWYRSTWRYVRIAVHVCEALITVSLFYPLLPKPLHRRLRQHWSRRLLAIMAIELRVCGQLEVGTLLTANHISWLDIFVINAIQPVAFVAKSELRRWPLVGCLAARNDTLFLHRQRSRHARQINHDIADMLSCGHGVAIFPEGTTSDGKQVLPFHAALLESATTGSNRLQMLALRYENQAGEYCSAPVYDTSVNFAQCLQALMRTPYIVARIDILPAISGNAYNRRTLAQTARRAIAAKVCAVAETGVEQ